jgi:hypothetical protein
MWETFKSLSMTTRIVAILLAAGAIVGGVYVLYTHVKADGYNKCVGEYRDAADAAKSGDRDQVIKSQEKTDAKLQNLEGIKARDSLAGPFTSAALDQLQPHR